MVEVDVYGRFKVGDFVRIKYGRSAGNYAIIKKIHEINGEWYKTHSIYGVIGRTKLEAFTDGNAVPRVKNLTRIAAWAVTEATPPFTTTFMDFSGWCKIKQLQHFRSGISALKKTLEANTNVR